MLGMERGKGATGRRLAGNQRGAVLIEFALLAPVFLLMLLGILAWGGYFWRAHVVQQVANDAARAALAGLTAPEREALAKAAVGVDLQSAANGIRPADVTATVREAGPIVTVSLAYDGSRDAFMGLGLVPLPGRVVRRSAAVRLGGL